ncbi:MAG: DUF2029 domain-containing protein [Rhodospirillales bacterium]|nr:DUF2029 domain-containing protein [Rhodospirillales bacterium]
MIPRISGILHGAPLANTPPCDGVQCDFSVFWPASLLARQGRFNILYDPTAFSLFRQHVLFAGEPRLDWIYPPPSLLPLLPFGYLPLGAAFLAWTALLIVLAILMLRFAGISWLVVLISLLSPAALWDIEMGQWEIFCGAALVSGLVLLSKRTLSGGLVLSLLLFKPQSALLMPVALLAARYWRAIAAGLVGSMLICAATTLLMGFSVWRAWLQVGLADAHQILILGHSIGLEESTSVFWALRNAGAAVSAAFAGQALCAALAVIIVWHAWNSSRFAQLDRIVLTVIGSTLVVPYLFIVDLIAFEIVLTLLAERRGWRANLFDIFLWLWPMFSPAIFIWKGWLLSPLVMLSALLYFWLPGAFRFRRYSAA